MKDGKKIRQEKWLISIEIHPEWADAKMQALAASALPQIPEIIEGYLLEPPEADGIHDGEWEPDFDTPSQADAALEAGLNQAKAQDEFATGSTGAVEPAGSADEAPGTRPYPPEVVREKVQQWVEHFKGVRKDEPKGKMPLWQYVRWQLGECFFGDVNGDAKAHTVSAYLVDKNSAKDWNGAEAKAIEKWLNPTGEQPSGDLKPSAMARKEANQIVAKRMLELGQQALFSEGEESEE